MSKFPNFLLFASASALVATTALAEPLGLGRVATDDEVAAWDIDIRPDGLGLPEGSGDIWTGEEVFVEKCAVCHGDFGEGVDRWPVLAGGHGSLTSDRPVKTIGSFWPYLSTVYDYVYRAMPFGDAQSLEPDEVYAITAYLLYMNDVVTDDDFVLSNENFSDIVMPNVDAFYDDDREQSPIFLNRDACMSDCKDSVEITARAQVLDVTPEETAASAEAESMEMASDETAEPEMAEPEAPAGPDPELVAAGERVFGKCKACHQVGDDARNRTGPVLNGIIGAAAGQNPDFQYSNPLRTAADEGLVWTDEELIAFLTNPRSYMRGTRMSFAGLRDEADIEAVIAYLSTFPE